MALAFCGMFAQAQEYSWRLTYDVNIPMTEGFQDYISTTSWRGIGVDNRWMVTDKISVGVALSWHVFYEKKYGETKVVETDNRIITAYGNTFSYLNLWTGQVNAHYYFGSAGQINPWVGVGVGTSFANQSLEIGLYLIEAKPWSFSVSPQVGIDIPFNVSTDFTLGARYNINTNGTNDYGFNSLGINAGFKFTVF